MLNYEQHELFWIRSRIFYSDFNCNWNVLKSKSNSLLYQLEMERADSGINLTFFNCL